MTVSAVLGASFLLRDELSPADCAPRCPRSELPGFDQFAAGRFDRDARLVSDLTVAITISAAGLTAGLDGGLVHFVVAAEAVLVSSAITVMTAMAVQRPRPLVYSERAPLDDRTSGGATLSFPSGHTSNAFAATLALFHGMHAREPDSALPWVLLSVGLALSSTIGVSRVLAGDHFPSDVLAGAAIGTSIGWVVPALHRSGSGVAVVADADGYGFAFRGRL
jgi:membrane-associated phospholipid phosphatase